MTPLQAILVTGESRQPGLLSTEVATGALVLSVLTVDGVAYRPGDLLPGASLVVEDPESATLAAQAGFLVAPAAGETPTSAKRRFYSFESKVSGALLLMGAVVSLYWAVVRAIELDPSALVWLMLAPVLGLLGRFWWFSGDEELLRRDAVNETRAEWARRWLDDVKRKL